jgi:hypothetical protein
MRSSTVATVACENLRIKGISREAEEKKGVVFIAVIPGERRPNSKPFLGVGLNSKPQVGAPHSAFSFVQRSWNAGEQKEVRFSSYPVTRPWMSCFAQMAGAAGVVGRRFYDPGFSGEDAGDDSREM